MRELMPRTLSLLGWFLCVILLSVSCSGGSKGDPSSTDPSPTDPSPTDPSTTDPSPTDPPSSSKLISIDGRVFTFSGLAGASVEVIDAEGNPVETQAAEIQAFGSSQSVSDENGYFNLVFKGSLAPYLIKASTAEGNFYSFIFSNEQRELNINQFTTLNVDNLIGNQDGFPLEQDWPESLGKISSDETAFQVALNNEARNLLDFLETQNLAIFDNSVLDSAFEVVFTEQSERSLALGAPVELQLWLEKAVRNISLPRGSVSGTVKELNSGTPIRGAEITTPGTYAFAATDGMGGFLIDSVPVGQRIPINISAQGYAGNQEIVTIRQQQSVFAAKNVPDDRNVALAVILKPVSMSYKLDLGSGIVAQSSGSSQTLRIESPDGSLRIDLPLSATRNARDRAAASGRRALASSNDSSLTIEFTRVDPTTEREVFPGDFSAIDGSISAQSGEEEGITLESVVLADINLRDATGRLIQLEEGSEVPVRMRIPENLQDRYWEEFNTGTRTIPWWSYDEQQGIWIREGDSVLIDVDGILYAEGIATHFSWWNVDLPISTHARLCGKVVDSNLNPVRGATVLAEGVDYVGNSYETTNSDGEYEIRVMRLSQIRLSASSGEIVTPSRVVDVSDVSVGTCQDQGDLSLAVIRVSGRVLNGAGDPLSGVLVRADNGNAVYTDANGNFSIRSTADTILDLVASYVSQGIRNSTSNRVEVGFADITDADMLLDIHPVEVSGKVFVEDDGGQTPMMGAVVTAGNGQSATTDGNGFYRIYAANVPGSELAIDYEAYLPSEVRATRSKTVELDGASEIALEDVVFREAVANITGRVVNHNNRPFTGIEVTSSTGRTAVTNQEGSFTIRVPVNQEVSVTATFRNPQANMRVNVTSPSYFIHPRGGNYPIGDLRLDNRTAFIGGTVYTMTAQGEHRPLAGVKVVTEYGAVDTTGSNGKYQVRVPPFSHVNLTFSYELLNAAGQRERWGESESRTRSTLGLGVESMQDVDLELASNPPRITATSVNPATVAPGGKATFHASATDPDGDPLTYTWYDSAGQELGEGQSYEWTAPGETGVYELRVVVDDGTTAPSVSRVVQVQVRENSAPTILDMWLSPQAAQPGETIEARVSAFDIDGDVLTYHWSQSELKISETAENRFTFTLPLDFAEGAYKLQVSVTDPHEASTSRSVEFTVQNNRPPVITAVVATPSPAQAGDNIALTVTASDPDGDPLSYKWVDGTRASLGTSRSVSWRAPKVTGEEVFEFTVSVSDEEFTRSQSVFVNVLPIPQSGGSEPPPVVSGSTVSGFVSDQAGNPVADALVRLYSPDESVDLYTTTSAAGYYEFTGLEAGEYYVVVSRDGFTIGSALITVTE